MESSSSVAQTTSDGVVHEIDWDAYASQYDLLAKNNPSYHQNIEMLRSLIRKLELPKDARICDIGAGTGNYICALAKELPHARFVHLDADENMNAVAREKYRAAGIENVEVRCCKATEADLPRQEFDLIICINALYAIQPRDKLLESIKGWLRPTGTFFVIDFGRRARMIDWSFYIFGHILKEQGVRACFGFLSSAFEAIRQNRRGSQGQADGIYWLHTTEEFGQALEESGFKLDRLETCYRGYCDLAVCRVG